MVNNLANTKGKIIRDALHGDISIPDNFMKIIDTPEFQRLRRIRQLSTANMLFPTAEHTRFSHSIGCYHVMKLLIEHFLPILRSIKIEVDNVDIDLALAAALLHDVGTVLFPMHLKMRCQIMESKKNMNSGQRT